MDLRKLLLEKIGEVQFAIPAYSSVSTGSDPHVLQRQSSISRTSPSNSSPPVGPPPQTASSACNEIVWKIIDNCKDQFQSVESSNIDNRSSPYFRKDYVAKWNAVVWPILDLAILVNNWSMYRRQENSNDYSLRREIQQLLSKVRETSPIGLYIQQQPNPTDPNGLLYQHYLSADQQLTELGSMIGSRRVAEEQLSCVLGQYRNALTTFTNQIAPQILNEEASRIRSLEQQRHACAIHVQHAAASRASSPNDADSTSSKFSSKISDHLNGFRALLDWCFALVATLLSKTIELLNQSIIFAETNRYYSVTCNELHALVPAAVMGLCRFLLWVSAQPPMIMVTKTEFSCHCVLLNNYFTHGDHLHMQIVSESTAYDIQQKCFLKRVSLIGANSELNFPSAGILVMKKMDSLTNVPTTPTITLRRRLSTVSKRRRFSRNQTSSTPNSAVPSPPSSACGGAEEEDPFVFFNGTTKNDDFVLQNGGLIQTPYIQERLDIGWRFDQNSRILIAEAEQACCTDRNLTNDSPASLGSNGQASWADRQRDIYYLHCWSKIAVFGNWYEVHTLSLPFVIPTRKNQDLQLHRMLKSYSATIFWLHVAGRQDGFLIEWNDRMSWDQFRNSLNVYFMKEARVSRGLSDFDFMLLKEKAKCVDCGLDDSLQADKLSYQNIICPHLFYQCSDRPLLKHSLWRALLDLIQLFQNDRTKVRDLWDRGILGGLWSIDSVSKILARHAGPVLMARISLLSGGSILLSFSSGNVPATADGVGVIHTEPLDQHQLGRRNLIDCTTDIADSEGIGWVLDCNFQPVPTMSLSPPESVNNFQPVIVVRANSDQLGCPATHRQYLFHALKLSMIPCRNADRGSTSGPIALSKDTMRQVKSETPSTRFIHATSENVKKNVETELLELMHRYGYSGSDMFNACQQLVSGVKTGSKCS